MLFNPYIHLIYRRQEPHKGTHDELALVRITTNNGIEAFYSSHSDKGYGHNIRGLK